MACHSACRFLPPESDVYPQTAISYSSVPVTLASPNLSPRCEPFFKNDLRVTVLGLGFEMKLDRKREAAAGSNRLVFGFRVRVPFVVHICNAD